MSVICHHLPTARWRVLPEPCVPVTDAPWDALGAALASLAERCRGHGGFGDAISPAGWLAGRDTALQWAWLATTTAGVPVAAISLARRATQSGSRWSIPFVLVDPLSRRTGLAAGLVRRALAAAEQQGAAVVFAETLTTWGAASEFWAAVARRLAA
jgi:GNAT superfamily N-acetyltransferase